MKLSNKKRKVIFNTIDMEFMKVCQSEGIDFTGATEDMNHIQEAQYKILTDFVSGLGDKIAFNLQEDKPVY